MAQISTGSVQALAKNSNEQDTPKSGQMSRGKFDISKQNNQKSSRMHVASRRKIRKLTLAASNAPLLWNPASARHMRRMAMRMSRRKQMRAPFFNPHFSTRNIRRLTKVGSQSRVARATPTFHVAPNLGPFPATTEKAKAMPDAHPFFLGETMIYENPALTRNQPAILQQAKKTEKYLYLIAVHSFHLV